MPGLTPRSVAARSRRMWNGCRLRVGLVAAASVAANCLAVASGQDTAAPQPTQQAGARAPDSKTPGPAAAREPTIPIRFQGLLPGNVNPRLEGQFRLELRIYPSPQGGQPSWRETQEVRVIKGQIDILLGSKTPIPLEIHEATYKWLGAAVNGQREIFPRYPIVNVVYASPREALLAHERWQAENAPGKASPGHGGSDSAGIVSETRQEQLTWKEALDSVRARGSDLPDYEAWYRKLESLPPEKSPEWTGHYEWVMPWVYDTASHGKYNDLFRGRFQGCDYSDLSPQKKYFYHSTAPAARKPAQVEPSQPSSPESVPAKPSKESP